MFHPVRSTSCPAVFLFLLVLSTGVYAQTSIDDVHIAPRGIEMASSAPGPRFPAGSVIRTSADLVIVPVTITDEQNRPVLGLDQANFQLFENKKPQQIKNFSSEDSPVSIGIIVDTSGSMASKMDRAREAVQQFCEASNPQDEFFMITFADEPRQTIDFTTRPEKVENALLTSQSKGSTSLLDAIYMGIRKMKEARYGRRALLILSDGGDNHSRYSERDVKRAVKEADVLIYSVGIYDRYFRTQEELLGPELLRSVSDVSGGKAFTLNNVRDLPAVTGAIGSQLRHQYMLAYRPQPNSHDGKWYRINVKLRLPKTVHSLLRVEARAGYYAPAE